MLHMFTQVLFWTGNQDNNQNRPILSTQETLTDLNGDEAKKIFFEKKKIKMALKKTEFFTTANYQYFIAKVSGIGPWVSKINQCEQHQCGLAVLNFLLLHPLEN